MSCICGKTFPYTYICSKCNLYVCKDCGDKDKCGINKRHGRGKLIISNPCYCGYTIYNNMSDELYCDNCMTLICSKCSDNHLCDED